MSTEQDVAQAKKFLAELPELIAVMRAEPGTQDAVLYLTDLGAVVGAYIDDPTDPRLAAAAYAGMQEFNDLAIAAGARRITDLN